MATKYSIGKIQRLASWQMEKAVTALFNQLLLLFSIMQGINAESLTSLRWREVKGGEGCFYVIASITIYISGTYAWRVKGEGLLSFRFSNFQWFYPQIRYPIGCGLEFFFILMLSEGIKIEPFRSRKAMQRAVAWWSLPYEHDRHRLDEGDLYPSCWTSGHQRHK